MLYPEEEKRFEELRGMCRELKVPAPPEIMIGLKVHEGGVLTFDDVQRGHSWTRNYWDFLYQAYAGCVLSAAASWGAGNMTWRNTAGTIQPAGYEAYHTRMEHCIASVGFSTHGIVCGTGDTAFGVDQYTLVTQIVSGNAAGQLAYSVSNAATVAYTAGSKTWKATIARIFNNNSGGSITVKEVGIIGKTPVSTYYYLFERSVPSPTVPVPNGAQLMVTYEISMDFSAID
jgi:hypothetical protein